MIEHRSALCRLCAATCGIIVTVEDGRAIGVRGDPDHPDSRGYTCAKGRALADACHHADRLDAPTMNGRRVEWTELLDDLGQQMARIITQSGPNGVGYYSATGQFPDKAGLFAERRLFGALGTRSRYTAASVDIYPAMKAAELVTGYAGDLLPIWEPEHSPDVVLMVGQNPVVSHGYLTFLADPVRRIRDFRRRGGWLCVLDPRRSETAQLADLHLAPSPGSDAVVLAWIIRELLDHGADTTELERHVDPDDCARLRDALREFTLERVSERTGIEPEALATVLTAIRRSGKIAAVIGTGVTFGPHSVTTAWLVWALLIVTGSLDHEGGMRFVRGLINPLDERRDWDPAPPEGRIVPGPISRPDLPSFMGEYPVAALADEIEAGNLRALFVAGANPLTALPDPRRTIAALRQLDVLAVLDVRASEITDLATHVIPVNHQLERPDITLRDRGSFTPAVVSLGAERRPVWWVHAQLARRLGLDILDGLDPDRVDDVAVLQLILSSGFKGASTVFDPALAPTDESTAVAGRALFERLVRAGPHGEMAERRIGWVHRVLPHGRWRLAPHTLIARLPGLLDSPPADRLLLVSRRLPRRVNSAPSTYTPSDEARDAHDRAVVIHPTDALRVPVTDGARVRLTSDHGALEAAVRITTDIAPGTVSLTHGFAATNVNQLTDPLAVDPLTGQPQMTALAVRIEAIVGTHPS